MPFVSITVGNAVAALAFTIAFQQFLKPIHRFRLAARSLPLRTIFIGVYAAAAFVILGNTFRYFLPTSGWPAFLEILGGLLFFFAYLLTTFISLNSARFNKSNAARFSQSAYRMLSNATDEDYVSLFRDISKNIAPIARLADFNENYRWAGLDNKEPSAFYDFIHRHTIERSYFAGTLLRLLSDSRCCRAIILGDSISVVEFLRTVKDERLVSNSLGSFVQALARQSIAQDDAMLAREVGYTGFSAVRAFLDAMFGDDFINRHHEPLRGVEFSIDLKLTNSVSDRLATAVRSTWKSVGDIWHPQSLWPVSRVLKSAMLNARLEEEHNSDRSLRHFHLYRVVGELCELSHKRIVEYSKREYASSLFAANEETDHHRNVAGITAEIFVDALMSLANDFSGFEDRHWSDALDIVRSLFNSIGDEPDGLSPIQQRALMLIVENLQDNMKGYYPALTRLLIAVIGPYRSHQQKNNTAFRILEDAAYGVWRDFERLSKEDANKVDHYLPPNVTYDPAANSITHTYRGGNRRVTNLGALNLPTINPLDASLFQAGFVG